MKKFKLFLCTICVLLFSSCGFFTPEYSCEIDEVNLVQIVMIEGAVEGEYRYKYTVLTQVSDVEAFVSRLNEIPYSINWGDPYPIETQKIAIRIEYKNGDYDLLQQSGQSINRTGSGYYRFDDEEFEKLISSYYSM